MRSLRLPTLAVLCLVAFHGARAQSFVPAAHPNHYIVLVDASGSITRTAVAQRNFHKALTERLLPSLYGNGFGAAVPAFDPAQDLLTLNFFGVVTGSSADAFERLADYDLRKDFIHAEIVRGRNVSREALAARIVPTQTYNYTILSWAKQLALYGSGPQGGEEVSHRTFLIFVHDGRANENSIAEEISMVGRWSEANFKEVEPEVARINKDYKFTDGGGESRPAWTDKVDEAEGSVHAPVFLEAYEVVSAARADWEAEGRKLAPLDDFSIRWTKEDGAAPEGVLNATPSEKFKSWLGPTQGAEIALSVEQDGQLTTGQAPSLPFVARGALSCDSRPFKAALSATVKQRDALLGSRAVRYVYPRVVNAPQPSSCTVVYRTGLVVAGVLALLLLLYAACYLYYRFYKTDVEIQIPGTMVPIRLGRKGQPPVSVPVVPQRGLEALTLKLPGRFKQHLFHRGATVSLTPADGEAIHWAEGGDEQVIKLPLASEYVPAHWGRLPSKPAQITVSYRKGRRQSEVDLSYPGGARIGTKGAQV